MNKIPLYQTVIDEYYPNDNDLRRVLILHSLQVRDKALSIADMTENRDFVINRNLLITGAMLHDIGIFRCHAPGIYCNGDANYINHGLIGAELLRQWGRNHGVNMEAYARICERHTGSGLTAAEILREQLPLPAQDFLPESNEEKLIATADKFFSKSGDMREKSIPDITQSLTRFGADTLARWYELLKKFHLDKK